MDKINAGLIKYCNEYLNIGLNKNIGFDELYKAIEQQINDLITNNFQQLVYVLYKADVPENKLKRLLKENKQLDAASIINGLIIERIQQKINARNQFKNKDADIPEDENW